jgi:acyl-CoA synthetase (AMP-forming)/AMP-acid ligase II
VLQRTDAISGQEAPDREFQHLAELTRRNAGVFADRPAIVYGDETITYAELEDRILRAANGLLAEGLGKESRFGLLAKNGPDFYELMFAGAKTGAVLVPVNFRLAGPEIAYVLNDAGAEVLFVGRDFYDVVDAIRGELKTVRRIIAIDGERRDWEPFEDWRARQSNTETSADIQGFDVVVQMYTSGTTGHPKGVQLMHSNFLQLTGEAVRSWGNPWTPDDVNLVCMPLFHIGGSGWGLVGLHAGSKNLIARDFVPGQILKAIEQQRVTKTLFVPAMILFLLDAPECREIDFSSLDIVTYGASPIPLELLKRAVKTLGCKFAQLYGLTETTGAITYLPPEDHSDSAGERMRAAGLPLPGVEIRVVDGAGNDVPIGQVGEIICRSPQVMKGYWNLAEATTWAIRGEWFHSGDAGYLDADGYVYIHDRVKDMIVSGGENIYPAEVESALYGHPGVADVAVIGVPDERWGESVKAIVVPKPGSSLTPAELIEFARARIAGYKVPRSVDFIDALPRNPSGKILKRELRKPYWVDRERQVN